MTFSEGFCNVCGKALVPLEKVDHYDQKTGIAQHQYVCPTGKCEHTGYSHDYYRMHWWSCFHICSKCGDKFADYGI